MVTNFGLWVTETPLSPATSAELKLFSKKLELMGIVDAVHEVGKEVLLVDYKTSRRAEITPDMERQAALYCLLYQDQYGTVPSEIWFHFLATRGNPEVIQVDENLLQYGTILIDNIRRRTVSDEERDYPVYLWRQVPERVYPGLKHGTPLRGEVEAPQAAAAGQAMEFPESAVRVRKGLAETPGDGEPRGRAPGPASSGAENRAYPASSARGRAFLPATTPSGK